VDESPIARRPSIGQRVLLNVERLSRTAHNTINRWRRGLARQNKENWTDDGPRNWHSAFGNNPGIRGSTRFSRAEPSASARGSFQGRDQAHSWGFDSRLSEGGRSSAGAAREFMDAGPAPYTANRGALAGMLRGHYSTDYLNFVALNIIQKILGASGSNSGELQI
jgi:hypothetical protein